jgi:hypothetical protein
MENRQRPSKRRNTAILPENFIALKKKDIMTEKMDVDNISKTSADYYTDR